MARGDNLTDQDRARGGQHSHSGGRSRSSGSKGGRASSKSSDPRGLGSADQDTRERVSRLGREN